MTNLTRRGFFKHLTESLYDQVDVQSAQKAMSDFMVKEPVITKVADWVVVGRFSDFAPGNTKKIILDTKSICLISNHEGVWAEDESGQRLALRLDSLGTLSVHSEIFWDNHNVLLHMTGEKYDG